MFNVDKVRSVYSGKNGCCCGCRGNHRYASAFVDQASKDRGYQVTSDEVSDRSVKMVVNKVQKFFQDQATDRVFWDDGFVSVDHGGRTYTVYFAD